MSDGASSSPAAHAEAELQEPMNKGGGAGAAFTYGAVVSLPVKNGPEVWASVDSTAMLQQDQDAEKGDAEDAAAANDGIKFDTELYRTIRMRESMVVPLPKCLACCRCLAREPDATSAERRAGIVLSPETWFVISQLLFFLPFMWSTLSPVLTLRPPAALFFTGCFVTGNESHTLAYAECLACNSGSPRVDTARVDVLDAYLRALARNAQMIIYMLLAPPLMTLSMRHFAFRATRNEVMLAFHVFLRPIPFRIISGRGIALFFAVFVVLAQTIYVSVISSDVLGNFKSQMRIGTDGVCVSSSSWNGTRVTPNIDNYDVSFERFLQPAYVLGNLLIYAPVLLKLWRGSASPFHSLHVEDVLDHGQRSESAAAGDRSGGARSMFQRLRVIEEADFNRAVSLLQDRRGIPDGGCDFYLPKHSTFAIKWGTTVADVAEACRIADAVREQRLERQRRFERYLAGDETALEEYERLLVGGNEILWDRWEARDYVRAKLYGGAASPHEKPDDETPAADPKAPTPQEKLAIRKQRKGRQWAIDPGRF